MTAVFMMSIMVTMKANYTTGEVAAQIGVSKKTLLRWLWGGKLTEPKQRIAIGSIENRIWSAADLERARAFREANYRKRP